MLAPDEQGARRDSGEFARSGHGVGAPVSVGCEEGAELSAGSGDGCPRFARAATRLSSSAGCRIIVSPSPMTVIKRIMAARLAGMMRSIASPSRGSAMSRIGVGARVPGRVGAAPSRTRASTRFGRSSAYHSDQAPPPEAQARVALSNASASRSPSRKSTTCFR